MSIASRALRFLSGSPAPVTAASTSSQSPISPSTESPSSLSSKANTPKVQRPPARAAVHNPLVDLPLSEFIAQQTPVAWKRLLANVNPAGTEPGCVVASPSKALPDYWYEWTRDSAVVERNIVYRFVKEGRSEDFELLKEYIEASRIMQHKETVIGGFSNGGLGEVKYHVNHEPFTGDWGRPQADGPGSRILTLGTLAIHLLEKGDESQKAYVKKALYPGSAETTRVEETGVLKGDLEYVVGHWQLKGFDLWEEVSGVHFYTLLTLRSSLQLGARLATLTNDVAAATRYTTTADTITPVLARFWDAEREVLRVTIDHGKEEGAVGGWAGTADGPDRAAENLKEGEVETEEEAEERELASHENETHGKTSELDVAVVLAVLHAGRKSSWAKITTGGGEAEAAEKVLATLAKLVEAFSTEYPLNKGRLEKGEAVALGRYPEDVYDGVGVSKASPWYLCTLAASEFLFLLISDLASLSSSSTTSSFTLTPLLHSSLSALLPSLTLPAVGSSISATSPIFPTLLHALFTLADSFISVVQQYVGVSGQLSEQFERSGVPHGSDEHDHGVLEDSKKDQATGEEVEAIGRGARDLTWSYAAWITAAEERETAKKALAEVEFAIKGANGKEPF